MKIKAIYAVFLTLAMGTSTGAVAQKAAENIQKYATLERIVSKNGWLVSDNAAGLIFNQANYSIADIRYDFEKGGLRNVNTAASSHLAGIKSESFRRWGRLSFYGKIGFDYNSSINRQWAGNVDMYTSPMNLGDSIAGNTRGEKYFIKAGVAYQMGKWVIGAMAEYENQSLAKRRDIRNKNAYMHLSIRPGVMFQSKAVNAGLNFTYERTSEEVEYNVFGSNSSLSTVYLFEGLWFYETEQTNGFLDEIRYRGSKYGGSAQLEFNLSKSVKFFNQFSMDYTTMKRYRQPQGKHLGDNDQLNYRYLGVVTVSGQGTDHRLSVDASFGDLLKYNNIQELVTDPITNQKNYVQYGKIQKFAQTQRRVNASYNLYVKRNAWSSAWIVGVDYNYFKNASEYKIAPVVYQQDMHYSRFGAHVTKNFLLGKNNWLDVTLKGGYTRGNGNPLEEIAPENVEIENPNFRADLLLQEYGFMTANRLSGEAGVRYSHFFPKKKMGMYVDLSGRCDWARNGLLKGTRRGGVTATVGVSF